MKIKEIVQTTPNFQVLSEDEIERIYFDALGIMESVGARVDSETALALFRNSEAVITDKNRVRIPAVLVEEALRRHPRKIAIAGRDRTRAVRAQKDELSFGAGPLYPLNFPDNGAENPLSPERQLYDATRLADSLENIDFITGPLFSSWQPGVKPIKTVFSTLLRGSEKPFLLGSPSLDELQRLWQMAVLVCGGEAEFRLSPLFVHYLEIDSPLVLSAAAAEKLLFCADKRIPCVCASRAIPGVSAPASVAGTLVLSLAETMLVSVLSYLQKPGIPLIRGSLPISEAYGDRPCYLCTPKMPLTAAANTDVSKWLGIGMLSPAGITGADAIGQEAGVGCTTSLYCAFLSGADMICGLGLMNSGAAASLDSLIMCDEIIQMIKQIGQGINTDDEYLALDLIDAVGPGGEYLTQDHTFEYWQKWFRPRLIDRSGYDAWQATGKKMMKDRIAAERRRILAEYEPAPLEEKLLQELAAMENPG